MNTHQTQDRELLRGVFSSRESAVIGTGATRRRVDKTVYYYAEESKEGQVALRPLNDKWVPQGRAEIVELEFFIQKYQPEPDIYKTQTLPAIREMNKTLAKAERLRSQGQPYSAEYEFKNALEIDSENVRGNFGLGLTYLDQGKNEEAHGVLKKLVKLDEAFTPENKHLFNEFGIKLRKNGMFDQALSYYASAYKLASDDENLCYNIARTLYEKGDLDNCEIYLNKALHLRPGFPEAVGMLNAVRKYKAERDGS